MPEPPADQPLAELSDEQLIELYQRGRSEVFPTLIERYQRELFNFLARFCGNRALAEDAFQETFLQVHLSAETFDPERRFKPWLFTIAANKARDLMRKKARRPAAALDARVGGDEDDGRRFGDLLQADLPLPDTSLDQAELAERVERIVSRMPEHLREILLLAYFQQLAYNDIADVLGIPLGTVKSRLHTAVATFGKMWKAANPDYEPS